MFEIISSKHIYHANELQKIYDNQIKGSLPYVVRMTKNNGVRGYILKNLEYANEANTLSFAQDTFSVFYQKQKYFTGNKVKILKPRFTNTNENIMRYITASLQKTLINLSWGIGSTIESIGEMEFMLPITKEGEIDFDFMERFIAELEAEHIAELEAEHIAELEAYLIATGLKDTNLTTQESQALKDFRESRIKWGEFKIGELFEKLSLRFLKPKFDKNNDILSEQTPEFNLPLVNAKNGDNGIMYYGRESDFESAELTIDIVGDGAVSAGNVYSQPQKTGVLYNAYLIKPKFTTNTKMLHFLTTCIFKSIKPKYSYDNKAGWDKVKQETIYLPITKEGKIDFDFMERFVVAMQKLVIKNVVLYSDKKIEITKNR